MGSLRALVGDQQVQSLQMQGTGAKVEEDRPGGGGLCRECGATKPNAGAPGTRLGLNQPLCRSRKLRHRQFEIGVAGDPERPSFGAKPVEGVGELLGAADQILLGTCPLGLAGRRAMSFSAPVAR